MIKRSIGLEHLGTDARHKFLSLWQFIYFLFCQVMEGRNLQISYFVRSCRDVVYKFPILSGHGGM